MRAAESLAMGNPMAVEAPPKSPVDFHEEKMTKTTTVVMSKHTLDTQPQVFNNCRDFAPSPIVSMTEY